MSFFGFFGPPNIEKMKAKRDVKGLIKALHSWDFLIKEKAAEALGQLEDVRAIEPLVAALNDMSYSVRHAAAAALAQLGDARGVEALIVTLNFGESTYARTAAAKILGQLGGAWAVESLINALKDKDREIRETAADVLAEIGDAHLSDLQRATVAIYHAISQGGWEKIRKFGDVAVEPLIDTLKNTDLFKRHFSAHEDDVRAYKAAVTTLAQIGGTRAIDFLRTALEDKNDLVRDAAAGALAESGNDVQAVESFAAALKDENVETRKNAAKWLGRIKNESALKLLLEALRDLDQSVSAAAAEALGQIGDVHAVGALIAVLQDQGKSSEERTASARALGKINDVRAVESLISSLQIQDISIASASAWALGRIGDIRAVGPLTAVIQEGALFTYTEVVESLERILKRNKTSIASEVLYAVADLKNATIQVKPPVCNLAGEYYEIDYSPIRQLARQELIRRGEEA